MKNSFTWAKTIVMRLQDAGYKAFFVGGCVRDMVMNNTPVDYDISTDAPVDILHQLFRRTVGVGEAFGVVLVVDKGHKCQVGTFRDGTTTPEHDAQKRDFTINGLFYNPIDEKVYDWVNGIHDIRHKIIRATGSPEERFTEDPLRLLRGIRLAVTLGFTIEKKTFNTIKKMVHAISQPSPERIRDELIKICSHPNCLEGINLLDTSGMLKILFPAFYQTIHKKNITVFEYAKKLIAGIKQPQFHLVLASLLCGFCYANYPDKILWEQKKISCKEVKIFLSHYKFSNRDKLLISDILTNHLKFIHAAKLTVGKKKKLMQSKSFSMELEFHEIHLSADEKPLSSYYQLNDLYETLTPDQILPEPLISGTDLLSLGIKPSPQYSRILQQIDLEQLENNIQTKTDAMNWIKNRYIKK